MRRAFFGRAPAFVVNLGGGDVAVTEQFLHFPNVDAGVEQQGRGGRPQGMRAVEPRTFLDRPGQLCHVACNDSVHAGLAHGLVTKLIAVGRAASPENRPGRKSSFPKVFGKRLGGGEMDADGAVAVAFLVDGEGGHVAVLVKVPQSQPAGGGKPDAGVEIGFQDGAIAEIEHIVAGWKTHQLAGAGGGERVRALQRIGRLASDELGVGGIRDVDRQPEFGGGARQVLVEARERGDAAVEGLGGLGCGRHGVAPALHVSDRGEQQPEGFLRPGEAKEVDETQDVASVGALSMVAGAAGDPTLEQLGDAAIEAFGPGAELRGLVAGEDGRQLVGIPQDDQVAIVGRSHGSVAHEYRVPKGG
jgi:hypothetical protein